MQNPTSKEHDGAFERETATRLVLLTERLGVLTQGVKEASEEDRKWRDAASKSIDDIKSIQHDTTRDISSMKEDIKSFRVQVKEDIEEIKNQVEEKVGTSYFRGIWRIVIGTGIILAAMSTVLTILKSLRIIP